MQRPPSVAGVAQTQLVRVVLVQGEALRQRDARDLSLHGLLVQPLLHLNIHSQVRFPRVPPPCLQPALFPK